MFVVLMLFLVLCDIEFWCPCSAVLRPAQLPRGGGAPRARAALHHARAFPVVGT